jgi:hypothetical protein
MSCKSSSCSDKCSSSSSDNCCTNKNISVSEKKTLEQLDSIKNYKKVQLETAQSLKSIAGNLLSILQNATSCGCSTDVSCYQPEAENAADQYYKVASRTCNARKITLVGESKLYATVDSSGNPLSYESGFGGIKTANNITGDLVFQTSTVTMAEGDDVAYVAEQMRSKVCKKVGIEDGTELSITLSSACTLTLNFLSQDLGSVEESFVIADTERADYDDLVAAIKDKFDVYVFDVWYDTTNGILRIILKAGYTVGFKTSVTSGVTIKTYINDTEVTSIAATTTYKYCYGYLEFFSSCEGFEIAYPTDALADPDVVMLEVKEDNDNWATLVGLNLHNMWCCLFETLFKVCIRYDRCSTNTVDVKIFYSWALLLKSIIANLDFECTNYGNWRRNNMIDTIESLIETLDSISIIVENQKDMIKIIKCDYLEFSKTCCKKTHRLY